MKILFVIEERRMGGGIASSSINLANELHKRGHSVSYLIMKNTFFPEEALDDGISILHLSGFSKYWNIGVQDIKNAGFFKAVFFALIFLLKVICNRLHIWEPIAFRKNQKIGGEYDVAIAFRQSRYSYYYVSNCVNAKTKIGFVHVDLKNNPSINSLIGDMMKMDRVAFVSDAVKAEFVRQYPQLTPKACTIYNLFDVKKIRSLMLEPIEMPKKDGVFRIITVSRIENTQKRIDWIPLICAELKKTGIPFEWLVVGDGDDRDADIALSEQLGTDDVLHFVGKQLNPYSWLHQSDISVLPSLCESYGMVVVESMLTGTPSVSAYYPALNEVLTDERMGLVAEPSVSSLVEKILYYMNNTDNSFSISKEFLSDYQYSNDFVYKQFLAAANEKSEC